MQEPGEAVDSIASAIGKTPRFTVLFTKSLQGKLCWQATSSPFTEIALAGFMDRLWYAVGCKVLLLVSPQEQAYFAAMKDWLANNADRIEVIPCNWRELATEAGEAPDDSSNHEEAHRRQNQPSVDLSPLRQSAETICCYRHFLPAAWQVSVVGRGTVMRHRCRPTNAWWLRGMARIPLAWTKTRIEASIWRQYIAAMRDT